MLTVAQTRFHKVREAKEFLASKIVDQAEREGASLSEIERKMLFFTEVGWTLPDMMQVSDEFDREYDQADYEKKIAHLIENLDKRLRKENLAEYEDWRSAIEFLGPKDHYINVMIGQAGLGPSGDRKKLWTIAFVFIALFLCFIYVAAQHNGQLGSFEKYLPSKESIGKIFFAAWIIAIAFVSVHGLIRLILGGEKTARLTARLLTRFFPSRGSQEED